MLARFQVIVAVNKSTLGIGYQGTIEWRLKDDLQFFRDVTIGGKNNAVIMGRKTYESVPEKFRPLSSRLNVVLSRTTKFDQVVNCTSLDEALFTIKTHHPNIDQVFIAGGVDLYTQALTNYSYLCDAIYVTWVPGNYKCDVFFPFSDDQLTKMARETTVLVDKEAYTRKKYLLNIKHQEQEYLRLLGDILDRGDDKPDRTGIGTRSLFGEKMVFDLNSSFPLITTKKVFWNGIVKELLFFIKGQTDTNHLVSQGVNIWKGNTSEEYLRSHNLPWNEGDMGPGYGFQWRHWGTEYTGCNADYSGKGIDQLTKLITNLDKNPYDRRHILTSWNVADIDLMALPPCHLMAQFSVSSDRKLSCLVFQRSGDMFLGVPFNIASYALLTLMICRLLSFRPGKLTLVIGDAHIYNSHFDQVKLQLHRTPYPFPLLSFTGIQEKIDDFDFSHIVLSNYLCHESIKANMAV